MMHFDELVFFLTQLPQHKVANAINLSYLIKTILSNDVT